MVIVFTVHRQVDAPLAPGTSPFITFLLSVFVVPHALGALLAGLQKRACLFRHYMLHHFLTVSPPFSPYEWLPHSSQP